MSAAIATLRDPAAVADAKRALLRDFIHENCGFVQIHAEVAQTFAEIGDDAGMNYALKRLVLHVRAAAQSANELKALS